jgi:type II secretory pathway pseudopilin PulG
MTVPNMLSGAAELARKAAEELARRAAEEAARRAAEEAARQAQQAAAEQAQRALAGVGQLLSSLRNAVVDRFEGSSPTPGNTPATGQTPGALNVLNLEGAQHFEGDPPGVVRVPVTELPPETQAQVDAAVALSTGTGIDPGVSVSEDGWMAVDEHTGMAVSVDSTTGAVTPFNAATPSALSVFFGVDMSNPEAAEAAWQQGLEVAGRPDSQAWTPPDRDADGQTDPLTQPELNALITEGYEVAVFDPATGRSIIVGPNSSAEDRASLQNIGFAADRPEGAPPLVYRVLGGGPVDETVLADVSARYVSPERQVELQQWAEGNRLASDDQSPGLNPTTVNSALAGGSELGELTHAEQLFLLDSAMSGWLAEPTGSETTVNWMAIESLALTAGEDPRTGPVVAEFFAEQAVETAYFHERDNVTLGYQSSYATFAVMAAGDHAGMVQMLEDLGPQHIPTLSESFLLDPQHQDVRLGGVDVYGWSAGWDARYTAAMSLLEATTTVPPNESTALLVTTMLNSIAEESYGWRPHELAVDVSSTVSSALAHMWFHGQDPALAASEAARLDSFLDNPDWRGVFVGEQVSPELHMRAFQLFLSNPEWTPASLAAHGTGWENSLIMQEMAQPALGAYAMTAGQTDSLQLGAQMQDYVFGIMYPGLSPAELPGSAASSVDTVTGAIEGLFGEGAQVEVETIPVMLGSNEHGPVQLPVFRVTGPNGDPEYFIDNSGRHYSSMEAYAQENQLPGGRLIYPQPGETPGEFTVQSPVITRDSTGDTLALAGGIVGGMMIMTGVGAPVGVGMVAASSAYGVYRNVEQLHDRATHGQTLSPTDPQALMLWADTAANLLSLGAMGASGASRILFGAGTRGQALMQTAGWVMNGAGVAADMTSIGATGLYLAQNWDNIPPGQRAYLAGNMAFMGVLSVNSARSFLSEGPQLVEAWRASGVQSFDEFVLRATYGQGNWQVLKGDPSGAAIRFSATGDALKGLSSGQTGTFAVTIDGKRATVTMVHFTPQGGFSFDGTTNANMDLLFGMPGPIICCYPAQARQWLIANGYPQYANRIIGDWTTVTHLYSTQKGGLAIVPGK